MSRKKGKEAASGEDGNTVCKAFKHNQNPNAK
jgi:hypothetical protein